MYSISYSNDSKSFKEGFGLLFRSSSQTSFGIAS